MSSHSASLEAALADRYAVERELGEGGMATVYLATDLKHKRPVAIKVLKPDLAARLGAERFLAEIEITAGLQHPHILPLYNSGRVDHTLYYVMPYVEGESLRDRLERAGPLDVTEAVKIARRVADALSYAHGRGVIHRDIKPANLLLVAGHPVVADFGVARAVTAAGGEARIREGTIVGSPAYMSPEQAKEEEIDGRADQYALACVLYEMLTGEPPFTGQGLAVLASHVHDDAPSASVERAEVPTEVDAAIRRALAKSPEERYPTAQDFGEALNSALRRRAVRRHATLPATLVTYAAAGWLLFQVASSVARAYLLPDWVPQGAIALLLAGLPVFLVTGFLQRRSHGAVTGARRLFSWRNALGGGAIAFSALGLGAGGYLASRAFGVGPAATLVARGVFAEREPLILADFGGTDSVLARTATEALRIDLAGSESVRLMLPDTVRAALERMRRDPDAPLDPRAARELAIREGLKGVVTGSVHSAGDGHMLSVQLLTAADGDPVLSERESGAGPEGFFAAVDELSARIRERLGESVRSIRSSPPLEHYTTASLEALEAYTAALRAENRGDNATALARYEAAVEIDSTFALAHRKIAIALANRREEKDRMVRAATRAYEFRDRLPEVERLYVESSFHIGVTGDPGAWVPVEERISELRGFITPNLGSAYRELGDYVSAERALRAATDGGYSVIAPLNLWELHVDLGKPDEAAATVALLEEREPDDPRVAWARAHYTASQGEYVQAAALFRELRANSDRSGGVDASRMLGYLAAIHGRLSAAEARFFEAIATHRERGFGGDYLATVVELAEIDLLVERDTAKALGRTHGALTSYPLASLPPHDRPYETLARLFADAGDPGGARRLLAEYGSEIEPKHMGRELERFRSRAHAALAEGNGRLVLTELERLDDMVRAADPMVRLSLLGRAYEIIGQPDSAVAVYERYLATPRWNKPVWDALYLARVHERLGQLYDEQDDLENAARHYAIFVELWAGADDELQPRVHAARERLRQIVAVRG